MTANTLDSYVCDLLNNVVVPEPNLIDQQAALAEAARIKEEILEKDRERKRKFRELNPHFNRWEMMKRRCLDPRHKSYIHYGGRGIMIYSPWITDFSLFNDWLNSALGPCPEGHTLDRIDNDRGYEPGNLRWATQEEQLKNRGY